LKLYYSPGACSLAANIALEEAGADYEAERVVLADGDHRRPEYLAINPHSRVPALATDGVVITENIAILNYMADLFGAEGSVPRGVALEAARCNELLGWFSSSVHIAFAGVWRAERFTDDETAWPAIQSGGRAAVERSFAEIEGLCGPGWIAGRQFTAADSYVAVIFRGGRRNGLDMSEFGKMAALVSRVTARPAVARAIAREGLQLNEFAAERVE
jgi:glutathione S-transferase